LTRDLPASAGLLWDEEEGGSRLKAGMTGV